jgi:glyoxylase-like metal-dependent hydrolase (beta-lactamase superfamily II)
MDVTLLKAGYCTQWDRLARTTGKMKKIQFPATFLLIKHPTMGTVLFDTGYAPRVQEAMKVFPYKIHGLLTPVFLKPGESAKEQLESKGIAAKDVSYIILSHFHVDHMGGLRDFQNAKFICSKEEYIEVKDKKDYAAMKSAFNPNLLPTDFEKRSIYLENQRKVQTPIFNDIFPEAYDLFGDGSILGIKLPGHTSHQYGILLTYKNQPHFFIADATWLTETYESLALPSGLAKWYLGLGKDYYETIDQLHRLHKKYPHVKLIPCHDNDVKI